MPGCQLKFPAIFQPYISQDTIDSAAEKVEQTRNLLEKWLSPFEYSLMTLQSLLVWEKPWKSFGLLVSVVLTFW